MKISNPGLITTFVRQTHLLPNKLQVMHIHTIFHHTDMTAVLIFSSHFMHLTNIILFNSCKIKTQLKFCWRVIFFLDNTPSSKKKKKHFSHICTFNVLQMWAFSKCGVQCSWRCTEVRSSWWDIQRIMMAIPITLLARCTPTRSLCRILILGSNPADWEDPGAIYNNASNKKDSTKYIPAVFMTGHSDYISSDTWKIT